MSNDYSPVLFAGKTEKQILEAISDILNNGESPEYHGIRIMTLMANCYPYFKKVDQS